MTGAITAGQVLVAGGIHLPNSLQMQSDSDSNGWAVIREAGATFEKTIEDAGWTFFFMAGEITAKVFGFDRQRSLRVALQRLIANAKSQHCNSIEITQVVT